MKSERKLRVWGEEPKPEVGFSLLGKEERNEVVKRYGEFLEACPVDPLVGMEY